MNADESATRRDQFAGPPALVPAGLLVLVLLPLLLMPLAAIFVFAFRGGFGEFWRALGTSDAQFALRFSLLVAFATAIVNAVLGTFAAYVLSKYRFPASSRWASSSICRLRSRP